MEKKFISIEPQELKVPDLHQTLLGLVAPRPIAFASTLDREGNPNLAPFSFFNVFSSNPPIVIFSPNRSGRTGKNKDTIHNLMDTMEVVINMVSYDIVQQMNVAACEYPLAINEFTKSGLTPINSDCVKPFRVKESPAQLECKVEQIITLGSQGGAGNLVVCKVLKIHIDENIIHEKYKIDPHKIDLVARMGADFYCRASGDAVFEVPKPNQKLGIGFDLLPDFLKYHKNLTGNELGQLANLETLPSEEDIKNFKNENQEFLHQFKNSEEKIQWAKNQLALYPNDTYFILKVLMTIKV
ncbi:MAG: flavin reductase [Bacteroidia bacterium]|nr:MAG: flavin reductase [Bacteroidia bacterium]